SGLMGPLAGVGDSLCVVIPWTIFGAIAANMAIDGSPVGIFLWIAVSVAIKLCSFPLFKAGYFSGTKLVNALESKMKSITKGTSILGLMVVGGLISTVIRTTVGFSFVQGEIEMTGQSILDQIMPGLLPAAIVAIMYYLLGKKVKPTYLILLVIAISIVLYSLGVLK
ncbi:MAG: PTS system mannose/fructose/sorbose family transporter subunit IID, partial [Intestinibacter bartlettii]|nr:PTS system mannose/fructose/sorbose family transporter subunit IID [Intestinibacter bartlettii]